MRKTLVAVAFAGAALAPAASLTVAATFAPTAAVAAPKARHAKARLVKFRLVKRRRLRNRRPLVRRPGFRLARRCVLPRVSVRREIRRLHIAGFRNIHYVGRTYYRPRCAMFLRFNACKGLTRYRVMVRYIHFRRFVIALNKGRCLRVLRRP